MQSKFQFINVMLKKRNIKEIKVQTDVSDLNHNPNTAVNMFVYVCLYLHLAIFYYLKIK